MGDRVNDREWLHANGEQLPCGCWMGTREVEGERQFVIEPCDLDCTYYRYAARESARQGNRAEFRFQK